MPRIACFEGGPLQSIKLCVSTKIPLGQKRFALRAGVAKRISLRTDAYPVSGKSASNVSAVDVSLWPPDAVRLLELFCFVFSHRVTGGEIGRGVSPGGRACQWSARVVQKLQADHLLPNISKREGGINVLFYVSVRPPCIFLGGPMCVYLLRVRVLCAWHRRTSRLTLPFFPYTCLGVGEAHHSQGEGGCT